MFKKKSTKELVHPTGGAEAPQTEKPHKEKKPKIKKPKKLGKINHTFFKTKTFFGLVCMGLALLIAFMALPMLQQKTSQLVPVYCFAQDVNVGAVVSDGMLQEVDMVSYHLPHGTITDKERALGHYVTTDALAGDVVTSGRLSDTFPGSDPQLAALPEGKMVVSVTLPELAESVSGKLRPGDIIQLFAVIDDDSYNATVPTELQYVEVLAVSDANGADVSDSKPLEQSGETESLNTVTLLVNEKQAAILAGLEHNATLHAALVIRGNEVAKEKALSAQDALFAEEIPAEDAPESTGR